MQGSKPCALPLGDTPTNRADEPQCERLVDVSVLSFRASTLGDANAHLTSFTKAGAFYTVFALIATPRERLFRRIQAEEWTIRGLAARFTPLATKPCSEGGKSASTRSACCFESKAAKTLAPVPVILASP